MLNEVENSTSDYIPWFGPEDIPFTKAVSNIALRMGSSNTHMLCSACLLPKGADSKKFCNRAGLPNSNGMILE